MIHHAARRPPLGGKAVPKEGTQPGIREGFLVEVTPGSESCLVRGLSQGRKHPIFPDAALEPESNCGSLINSLVLWVKRR